MTRGPAVVVASLLLLVPVGARGAPKSIPTDAVFRLEIGGIGAFEFTGSGNVTVSGSRVLVPAGLVELTATTVLPTTGSTAFDSVTFRRLRNAPGSFGPNGVAFQAPSEICPGADNHPNGVACHAGRGVGGVMPMSSLEFTVTVVPRVVLIPAVLPNLGRGGSTNVPFSFDFGVWSSGDAFVASADGTFRYATGGRKPLTLVSPVYIEVLGLKFPTVATLTLLDVGPGAAASCKPAGGGSAAGLVGIGIAGLLLCRRRAR